MYSKLSSLLMISPKAFAGNLSKLESLLYIPVRLTLFTHLKNAVIQSPSHPLCQRPLHKT